MSISLTLVMAFINFDIFGAFYENVDLSSEHAYTGCKEFTEICSGLQFRNKLEECRQLAIECLVKFASFNFILGRQKVTERVVSN